MLKSAVTVSLDDRLLDLALKYLIINIKYRLVQDMLTKFLQISGK